MTRAIVVGIFAAAVSTAAGSVSPTSVLTFHFDNVAGENYTAGGIVLDSSGQGNNGYLLATPGVPTWLAAGQSGGAFDFTGNGTTSGQSILVLHDASLNPGSGDFAIALWIRTDHEYDGDILRKGSSGTAGTWYKLEHSPSPWNDKISLNFNTTGTDATINSTLAYNDGQWHFVVAQRSGNEAQLWIDGALDGMAPVTGSIANTANLALGSKDTLNDDFLNSALDEVWIFNGALTADEIQAMYQPVPAPGSVLLVTLGTSFVGYLRRRKTL
ncbi:MAG: LamG domain-containing protein [Sedimentisphaerales bacterium]|nr:LamG domain-containing protein [Sedimentisphaerales bacterium]